MTETQIELLKEISGLWEKLEDEMSKTIDTSLTRQILEEREFYILSLQKKAQDVWNALIDSGLSYKDINFEINNIREKDKNL